MKRITVTLLLLGGTAPLATGQAVAKKVLMIGLDGAGGRYVEAANTPNLDALAAAGGARFDYFNEGGLFSNPPEPYGASGVNWSTIVTGTSADNHNVVDNSFVGGDFANNPHLFEHIKAADPALKTVSIVNWTPINVFLTPDDFADVELDSFGGSVTQRDELVKQSAVQQLAFADPDVMFLHLDQVDSAGHAFSWGSLQHTTAIEVVDGLVGEVMNSLNARPGVVAGEEDWLVLVTADHGAEAGAFGHVASQGEPNWEVPFIVSGPSVEDGVELAKGTLRDFSATALWHLGIDPFLAGLDGTVRGLTVESPTGAVGDLNGDGLLAGDGTGPAATDDVTTFLDNWLVAGGGGVADRYARGDLNFDGRTDLSDWALLNRLDPAMGSAIRLRLSGVPEPHALLLLLLATLPALSHR